MDAKHTPAPWRWEFNAEHKSLHLVGGRPQYDLTVMDFTRWGMGGAIPRVRDLTHDGMNILHRVCDRKDWITPFPGRNHHAHWCADVTHADMRLIAAAPELADVLDGLVYAIEHQNECGGSHAEDMLEKAIQNAKYVFAKATGA